MTTVDNLINVVAEMFSDPLDFDLNRVPLANSVDDPGVEDPSMVMSDYSEIESIRVSYGGGELYDIFVAKVKQYV